MKPVMQPRLANLRLLLLELVQLDAQLAILDEHAVHLVVDGAHLGLVLLPKLPRRTHDTRTFFSTTTGAAVCMMLAMNPIGSSGQRTDSIPADAALPAWKINFNYNQ